MSLLRTSRLDSSRRAITVRSSCQCDLGLAHCAVPALTFGSAYEIYKTPNKDDREMAIKDKTVPLSTQYRRIFGISRPVVLHFVGVWVSVTLFLTTEHAFSHHRARN